MYDKLTIVLTLNIYSISQVFIFQKSSKVSFYNYRNVVVVEQKTEMRQKNVKIVPWNLLENVLSWKKKGWRNWEKLVPHTKET